MIDNTHLDYGNSPCQKPAHNWSIINTIEKNIEKTWKRFGGHLKQHAKIQQTEKQIKKAVQSD